MNFGHLIQVRQIAALVHGWRAAHKCSGTGNGGKMNQQSAYRDGLGSEHGITQPAFR
jgi:hypothetical protein